MPHLESKQGSQLAASLDVMRVKTTSLNAAFHCGESTPFHEYMNFYFRIETFQTIITIDNAAGKEYTSPQQQL